MMEHVGAGRLIALDRQASSVGALVAWLRSARSLALGGDMGSGRCYIDIGKEDLRYRHLDAWLQRRLQRHYPESNTAELVPSKPKKHHHHYRRSIAL